MSKEGRRNRRTGRLRARRDGDDRALRCAVGGVRALERRATQITSDNINGTLHERIFVSEIVATPCRACGGWAVGRGVVRGRREGVRGTA